MSKTVVGYFEDLDKADKLVQDLKALGLSGDKINLAAHNPQGGKSPAFKEIDQGRPDSARAGAILGGAAGFLAGILALSVPGVGPVIVAGPLFAGLLGSAAGAAGGAIAGALKQNGVPDEEAEQYSQGIKSGGAVVLASVDDDQVEAVTRVMQEDGAVDIDERVPPKAAPKAALPYDPKAPSLRQRRLARGVRTYAGVR